MKWKKFSLAPVTRGLGIPIAEARKLRSRMVSAAETNPKWARRLRNTTYRPYTILPIVRLFRALELEWSPPTRRPDRFKYHEIEGFSPGLKWDKHVDSVPEKLFRVSMQDAAGKSAGTWLDLPMNIGCKIRPTQDRRLGYAEFLMERGGIQRLDGKPATVAGISGYVHDHDSPLINNLVKDTVTGKERNIGLAGKNIRGKVETAFMGMLSSMDIGILQSSILFNVRNNPIKGITLGLQDLYVKMGAVTILPPSNKYSSFLREANMEAAAKGDINVAKNNKGNGTVWLVYLDRDKIDMSGIPDVDVLQAFANAECKALGDCGEDKSPPLEDVEAYYRRISRIMNAAWERPVMDSWDPLQETIQHGEALYLPKAVFKPERLLDTNGGGIPNVHLMARTPDAERQKAEKFLALLNRINSDGCANADQPAILGDPEFRAGLRAEAAGLTIEEAKQLKGKICIEDRKFDLVLENGVFSYKGHDGAELCDIGKPNQMHLIPECALTPEVLACKDEQGRTLEAVLQGTMGKEKAAMEDESGAKSKPTFLSDPEEIRRWLDYAKVQHYAIKDWGVDVYGDVNIKALIRNGQLPVKFGRISGNFDCSYNGLETLAGAPEHVGGNFVCSYNKFTSLDGCPLVVEGNFMMTSTPCTSLVGGPVRVGGDYFCPDNRLKNLVGSPKFLGGGFFCHSNELVSLKGAPSRVDGEFSCSYNLLEDLQGAPDYVGGDFICCGNLLTNLKGMPKTVLGGIHTDDNRLPDQCNVDV